MKVAVLAALSVLITLPLAQAGQRHLQNGLAATTCDNDGHCSTLVATRPAASPRKVRPEIKKTIATARTQSAALDANGNATAGVIVSSKTGARARVGVAYATRFQAYIDDLENNHGARVLFMGGIRPGHCSPSSEHPCGKRWTCVSSGAASLIHAAICPAAGCSARSPLRTVCSKAGAGAIQIMVTRRSV
jgi:hypothetical protein